MALNGSVMLTATACRNDIRPAGVTTKNRRIIPLGKQRWQCLLRREGFARRVLCSRTPRIAFYNIPRLSFVTASLNSGEMGETETTPGILVTYPMFPSLIDSLDSKFTVYKLWEGQNPQNFVAEHAHSIRGLACNTVIGADAQLIDALPLLEVIATNSVGLDKVDLPKCRERNIAVAYTPDVLTDDVADLAIGLMLDTLRHISAADRYVRQALWPLKGDYLLTTKVLLLNYSFRFDILSYVRH
eukprot:Gb_37291 [translate_table: standard]